MSARDFINETLLPKLERVPFVAFCLFCRPVSKPRCIVEKPLGTHIFRLGFSLYNFLGKQTHAFGQRKRLYGTFRQHPSCYVSLDKVSPHCSDALGVQLDELRVIHFES
jgi:hypothetical protein